MCAVEAGHQKESTRKAVVRQRHTATERREEFVELAELKPKSKDDRGDPQDEESSPVAVGEAVCCEVARKGAGEQDDRVDDRYWVPVDVELACAVMGWRPREV